MAHLGVIGVGCDTTCERLKLGGREGIRLHLVAYAPIPCDHPPSNSLRPRSKRHIHKRHPHTPFTNELREAGRYGGGVAAQGVAMKLLHAAVAAEAAPLQSAGLGAHLRYPRCTRHRCRQQRCSGSAPLQRQ